MFSEASPFEWLRRLKVSGFNFVEGFAVLWLRRLKVSGFNFVEGFAVLWLRRLKVSEFDVVYGCLKLFENVSYCLMLLVSTFKPS
ncbi:MAG: hypothetical protein II037_11650 [Bacteroidales bacterium]|nr:hypothetical protein [Bacteroidales bacterium]